MRNTIDKNDYITTYMFFLMVEYLWFVSILFYPIKGFSRFTSQMVMIAIVIICAFFNCVVFLGWGRNNVTAVLGNFIPTGIYTAVVFAEYIPMIIKVVAAVSIVISVITIITIITIIFRQECKNSKNKKIRRCVATIRMTAMIASVVVVASVFIKSHSGRVKPESSGVRVITEDENDDEWKKNLLPINWKKTETTKERIAILQMLADEEAKNLGITKRLSIVVGETEDNASGCYSDKSEIITVAERSLMEDEVYVVVNIICHEVFHAAEYELITISDELREERRNLYFLRKAAVYDWEFQHYISVNENIAEYYAQECEKDAREYADERTCEIYREISRLSDDTDLHEKICQYFQKCREKQNELWGKD